MPNARSTAGDADFATPCAKLAPPTTPAPVSAVNMYRQALAAQPDHSVVIASGGYLGNLSDLLNSGPDAKQLIKNKVTSLVVMGGGYPSFGEETNLAGNPLAAQDVSANWPTKIVWSGYEIGENLFTGDTITSVHPSDSPVRVAYENFFAGGPNIAISSWDLTAVYYAVRPGDPSMREVGPGTNTITDAPTEANTFTADATGTQSYLELVDGAALGHSIEALLDTLPADPAPADPPPADPPPPTAATSTSAPASHPATTHAPATTPAPAPAPVADPPLLSRLGSLRIKKPASWIRRRGRFETTLASGCRVTVHVRPRRVATRLPAARQVRVGTTNAGAAPPFGSGRRPGGAWAVGYSSTHVVRGRASIRVANRRYVQVVADGILGSGCSDADAAALAQPIRTLVRMASYVPSRKSSSTRL
jgi:hypothetical protein